MPQYQIIAHRTLTEDSYNEGQIEATEQTLEPIEATIEADSTREAVIGMYCTHLYQVADFNNTDGHIMYTSHLVDEELLEPTEEELQSWKQGNMKLYTLDINISSYIHVPMDIEEAS